MNKEHPPLELTVEEAIYVFSAQGDFIHRLNAFVDSVAFYDMPESNQNFVLENIGKHEATYKKIAEYLSKTGCGSVPLTIYDRDTKNNITPKGGI